MPTPGNSFYLTIDKVYQRILVNELVAGIDKYKGKSAIGIIANPKTGEILAYTKDDVSLYADARMLKKNTKKRDKLAASLAKVFKTKPSKYINLIKKAKGNVCLEKKIDSYIFISHFIVIIILYGLSSGYKCIIQIY